MKNAKDDLNDRLFEDSSDDNDDEEQSYSGVQMKKKRNCFTCCGLGLTIAVFVSSLLISAVFLYKLLTNTSVQTSVIQVGGSLPVLLNDGFTTYQVATVDVALLNKTNSSVVINSGECIESTEETLLFHQVTIFPDSIERYMVITRPLFFLKGSSFVFNITAAEQSNNNAVTSSECADYLYLFDNYTAYLAFLSGADDNNAIVNYYYKSECISSDLGTWTVFEVDINETSFIYTSIELNSNNTIEIDISVNLVRYNTSDFKAYSLSYNETLTVLDCQSLQCLSHSKLCLYATSSDFAEIIMSISKQKQLNVSLSVGGIILSVIILFLVFISLTIVIWKSKKCTSKYKIRNPSHQEHPNDADNSHSVIGQRSKELLDSIGSDRRLTRSHSSVSTTTDFAFNNQGISCSSTIPCARTRSKSSHADLKVHDKHSGTSFGYVTENNQHMSCHSSIFDASSDLEDDCSTQRISCASSNTKITEEHAEWSDSSCVGEKNQHSNNNCQPHLTDFDPTNREFTGIFDEQAELTVNSSGLIHHCSQYGVTLIIPEEATQQSATVWFGTCLFSDNFQFEGDYVPATPIVWVYIDCELDKPADLYLPHNIDIESMTNPHNELLLLKADDESVPGKKITFKSCTEQCVEIEHNVIKISVHHFCSLCIVNETKPTPKRYVMARIDDRTSENIFDVHFCFLFNRSDCRKTLESQYPGLPVHSYIPFTFAKKGKLQLDFDPGDIPGWDYGYTGTRYEHITEDNVDFYKGLCEEGAYEDLKMREKDRSYPPRFTLHFEYLNLHVADPFVPQRRMHVKLTGVKESIISTIELSTKQVSIPIPTTSYSDSPLSSSWVIVGYLELSREEAGSCLSVILDVMTTEDHLKDKWFPFGLKVGLQVQQLQEIDDFSSGTAQCTRRVLYCYWKDDSKEKSWRPIAQALVEVGFSNLAHELRDRFLPPMDKPQHNAYCSLCNKQHYVVTDVPSIILNDAPSMAELNNLVGAKIEDKYHLFGVAVGLEEGYLRGLFKDYQTCQERFYQVFNKWKQTDPDSFTWSTVIRVLQSNTIKANELAEQVIEYLIKNKIIIAV